MIFQLLRVTFDVNRQVARDLAEKWTVHGHMLQGHPLAPLIFNLWTRTTTDYLNRLGRKQQFQIVQYADDIMIMDHRWRTSWNQIRYIMEQYEKLGFSINPEKEGIFHEGAEFKYLGMNIYSETGRIQPGNRRKHKAKIRALDYKNPDETDEHLCSIVRGIKAWLYNPLTPKRTDKPDTTISIPNNKRKRQKALPEWVLWANPTTLPEHYRRALGYA
jgi:hypothetical protein